MTMNVTTAPATPVLPAAGPIDLDVRPADQAAPATAAAPSPASSVAADSSALQGGAGRSSTMTLTRSNGNTAVSGSNNLTVVNNIAINKKRDDDRRPKKAETVSRAQALLQERLLQYGIMVKQFTLNEFRAPPSVIEAINAKNVMQQQALTAQNELQKNEFQARGDSIKAAGRAKAILTEAEAQARANRMLAENMTATLQRDLRIEGSTQAFFSSLLEE